MIPVKKIIYYFDKQNSFAYMEFEANDEIGFIHYNQNDYRNIFNPELFKPPILKENPEPLFNRAGLAKIQVQLNSDTAFILRMRENHIVAGSYSPSSVAIECYCTDPNSQIIVFLPTAVDLRLTLNLELRENKEFIENLRVAKDRITKIDLLYQVFHPEESQVPEKAHMQVSNYAFYRVDDLWKIVFKNNITIKNHKWIGFTYLYNLIHYQGVPLTPEFLLSSDISYSNRNPGRSANDTINADVDDLNETNNYSNNFNSDDNNSEDNNDNYESDQPYESEVEFNDVNRSHLDDLGLYISSYDETTKMGIQKKLEYLKSKAKNLLNEKDELDENTYNVLAIQLSDDIIKYESYLKNGIGRNNRNRNLNTASKKNYDRVKVAIDRAIKSIASCSPEFHQHLKNSVGPAKNWPAHLVYQPETKIAWITEAPSEEN